MFWDATVTVRVFVSPRAQHAATTGGFKTPLENENEKSAFYLRRSRK